MQKFILESCEGRDTVADNASSRRMVERIAVRFPYIPRLSQSTVNNYLNKVLTKPLKIRKTFYLSDKHKTERVEFCQKMINRNISGKNIMFTDEKMFHLMRPVNVQTRRIRFSKENIILVFRTIIFLTLLFPLIIFNTIFIIRIFI
jgi:hypothetical protein